MLYDMYWNKHMSSSEIAKFFDYKSSYTNIIQKVFKYLDIPAKNLS